MYGKDIELTSGKEEKKSLIGSNNSTNDPMFVNSGISASHKMKPTDQYMKVIGRERPIAIFMTVLFMTVAPLCFRYALMASSSAGSEKRTYYELGNATMRIETDWQCTSCEETDGVTLSSLKIHVDNVTNPDTEGGFPSVAIFASQDLETWYQYFNPAEEVQSAYISNWHASTIYINDTAPASRACLGGVYNNYLVACLNIQSLAFSANKGDSVRGPPFNDRCFQMASICGVPCADLEGGQYPPKCAKGDIPERLLTGNVTTEGSYYREELGWGMTLSLVDWLILITIFLDTFGNVLRFLPILSGLPTEVESTKSVQCSGTAILSNSTAIVSENEAIFLRSLVGRTLTVFHTIGSRHNIKGFYMDIIVNEKRSEKGDDKRMEMWAAWMQFLEVLSAIKTKDMSWEHNISTGDDVDNFSANDRGKPTASHLITDGKIPNTEGARVLRAVRIKRDQTVEFDCGLGAVQFQGVSTLSDSSYEYDLSLEDSDDSDDNDDETSDGQKPILQTQSLDIRSTKPLKQQEKLFQPPPRVGTKMENILPLISFLNGWLEAIKHKDRTCPYGDKTEALKCIFNDAPAAKFFDGDYLIEVQDRLLLLFSVFNGDKSQVILEQEGFLGRREHPYSKYIHRDDRCEVLWTITRAGLPDWQISFAYWSRSKLKQPHKDDDNVDDYEFESTRIKRNTVVFLKNDESVSHINGFDKWITSRAQTYKVKRIRTENGNRVADIEEWPAPKSLDIESNSWKEENPNKMTKTLDELVLIEKNRGKAGALNILLDYARFRGNKWAALNNVQFPVQTFAGIIDARHMISEPSIFWNEGLPHFARNQRGQGDQKKMHTILVQYPQYFSNVIRDDFLDNKNSGYYTIWQTLRDCAKCCTSSGTNAIWDITDPDFSYATTSRIEDTATTQQVFDKYMTKHLPCFVAYGIAKDTEDYIEAVYRWSTGAVELCWATIFSPQFLHFLVIGAAFLCFTFSSFVEYNFAYYTWLVYLFFIGVWGYYEKSNGSRPLRSLNVSCTIVMNSLYWISNLSSLMWVCVVPIRIAMFSEAPLSTTLEQSLFWAFISLSVRLPIGIVTDRVIAIARFLSPKTITDEWNYNLVLWRSSQLYVCSFAYTLLSVLSGSRTAFRAWWCDGDNTMWASYKISSDEMTKLRTNMKRHTSVVTFGYQYDLYVYLRTHIVNFYKSLSMPDAITKWLAAFLLILQVICMGVSVTVTNKENASYLLTTLVVCSINLLLVCDIALLLMPSLTGFLGRPIRLEYAFALLSLVVIVSLIITNNLESIGYYYSVI